MRSRAALFTAPALLSLAFGSLFAGPAFANQSPAVVGRVFIQSNDAGGNHVLVFDRHRDGTLAANGAYATGGTGTGTALGSQGAVILTDNGNLLVTVNVGSNDVSLFAVRRDRLHLLDTESSGGSMPVSVTVHGRLVYVLNGGDNTISGLRIENRALVPVAGSTRGIVHSDAIAPQIGFTPDGDQLVVTEKTTDTIDVFNVHRNGTTGAPRANASNGATPFGFAFDQRGRLFVTNAAGGATDASSLTSYSVRDNGRLATIDGPVPTTETAACWAVVSKNGRYVFATNTGSGSVSGYRIANRGSLSLLEADGVSATTGAGPVDVDFSGDGHYLYNLNGGSHSISIERMRADGSLDPVGTVSGLPGAAVGLAAT